MYSKSPGKAFKGMVQVKSSNGRLQLVFSYGGKRRYLSTGLVDTQTNRRLAQLKAGEIEKDILYERFDETLEKYKPLTPHISPLVAERDYRLLCSFYLSSAKYANLA